MAVAVTFLFGQCDWCGDENVLFFEGSSTSLEGRAFIIDNGPYDWAFIDGDTCMVHIKGALRTAVLAKRIPSGKLAKAMNGNVMMLQRLGIHAKDAQEALEILATRSMGSATREAESFSGQMKQLHNAFTAALEDFGTAIISSGGATNALGVLRSAVETLTEWIGKNKESISTWVTTGVAFAIDALTFVFTSAGGQLGTLPVQCPRCQTTYTINAINADKGQLSFGFSQQAPPSDAA